MRITSCAQGVSPKAACQPCGEAGEMTISIKIVGNDLEAQKRGTRHIR